MKIYVSNTFRNILISVFISSLSVPLCIFIYFLISKNSESIIYIPFASLYTYVALFDARYHKELLTYVITEDDAFTSYSFMGNKLYELDLKKDVYYTVFLEFSGGYFIAASNDKLEYKKPNGKFIIESNKRNKMLAINRFNYNKTLILPYNRETRTVLKLNEWTLTQI